MKSLMKDDELLTTVKGFEFSVPVATVSNQYDMLAPTEFPAIAIAELSTALDRPETTETGLAEGNTTADYQFAVFCRDCQDKSGELLTRTEAARRLVAELYDNLFIRYNMALLETTQPVPFDDTCAMAFLRTSCTIDKHDYTYSS